MANERLMLSESSSEEGDKVSYRHNTYSRRKKLCVCVCAVAKTGRRRRKVFPLLLFLSPGHYFLRVSSFEYMHRCGNVFHAGGVRLSPLGGALPLSGLH